MTEVEKYEGMRELGCSPVEVCRAAEADGLDLIMQIRLLRQIFDLSLIQAKAVGIEVRYGESLEEHQASLLPAIEDALAELAADLGETDGTSG